MMKTPFSHMYFVSAARQTAASSSCSDFAAMANMSSNQADTFSIISDTDTMNMVSVFISLLVVLCLALVCLGLISLRLMNLGLLIRRVLISLITLALISLLIMRRPQRLKDR